MPCCYDRPACLALFCGQLSEDGGHVALQGTGLAADMLGQ